MLTPPLRAGVTNFSLLEVDADIAAIKHAASTQTFLDPTGRKR